MHNLEQRIRASLLGIALACLAATGSQVQAQSTPTGSIEGRVQDVTRGNYLNNARVTVEGTSLTVLTNSFGEYRILAPNADGVLVKPALRLDYTDDFMPLPTAVLPDGQIMDGRQF